MKKYMEYKEKNDSVVNGEEIEFNGETHVIGKMTPEEIETMIEEGKELLKTEVTYKDHKRALSSIKSGKDLFNITEAIQLEGNLTGMWYVWRQIRMEERLKTFSPKAQKEIKALLSQ